jgi:hypothetical protein
MEEVQNENPELKIMQKFESEESEEMENEGESSGKSLL